MNPICTSNLKPQTSNLQIGGFVSFTTIDYPGKLAAVLFLYGCPMRCAYCSNPHLLELRDGEYEPEKIIELLESRRGRLEAVVFSGGEALMQGDATINYMRRVREMGFAIGLHTNGFYPEILERNIDVIDWVGLDWKATEKNYPRLSRAPDAYGRMIQTLGILVKNNKEFEVRITCDPRFITAIDLLEIAESAAARGTRHFAVQKYIAHSEPADKPTTEQQRNQFFTDATLRDKINALFESVVWRE
jgi:pyruvate formate lyase activating enzyme